MLRLPGCVAAVLIVLFTAGIVSGATSKAKVGEMVGRAMVQRDQAPAVELNAEAEFGPGDLLTLMPDAQVEIAFDNGSFLNLVGPAEVRLLQFDDKATKVALISGLINVARAAAVPMTVLTEYSVTIDMTDATGYAEVVPGDKMRFASRKGDGVTVMLLDEEKPLKAGDLPFLIRPKLILIIGVRPMVA